MNIPYDLIRDAAKSYFSADFVGSYINSIEKWVLNSQKWFFQVIQKNEKPTLEFGCITDRVMFDATASVERTDNTIVRLSSISIVAMEKTSYSTTLRIHIGSPNEAIYYTAVTEESRKQLCEYKDFIQSVIFGE